MVIPLARVPSCVAPVQEADNWLTKEYPKLVREMEAVFGAGRVKELFAPEAGGQPGAKTLTARGKLNAANLDLNALDTAESATVTEESLRLSAQRRRRILSSVNWVYRREEYLAIQQDSNVKTLDFESDDVPLWQRIRRASLFVTFVRRAEERIRARTISLADEMRRVPGCYRASRLPFSHFRLRKSRTSSTEQSPLPSPPGRRELLQANEPGTLRQNLRDLKVAEATVQLENLAREAGVDLATWVERPLEQCDGQIVVAFRDLKSVYDRLRTDLSGAAGASAEAFGRPVQRAGRIQVSVGCSWTRQTAGEADPHRGSLGECARRRSRPPTL